MQVMTSKTYFRAPEFKDLREMFYRSAKRYPESPAFMFKRKPDGPAETVSYKRMAGHAEALGTALCARGLSGERFAIIGENSYRWALAHMSVIMGLGVSVPLDRMLPENEIVDLLLRARPAALFYDPAYRKVFETHLPDLPFIRYFICMDEAETVAAPEPAGQGFPAADRKARQDGKRNPERHTAVNAEISDRLITLPQLLTEGKARREQGERAYVDAPIDREAGCSLLFTSGTTALSKAVILSHHNLCAEVTGLARVVRWKPGVRSLSILPLHHTFENTCGLLMILYYGGIVCECSGLRYIQKNMQEFQIDLVIGVPLIFESFYKKVQSAIKKEKMAEKVDKGVRLCRALRRCNIDIRRLVFKKILSAFGGRFCYGICGAAPIDPKIIRFFDDIGINVLQGYGMTETSPVSCGCNHRVFLPGSVGQPIGDTEVAIDCEKPGGDGEILVRGGIVTQGYQLDDGQIDRGLIDDEGWLHTGDMGRIGERGCLFITGRVKSMIVLKNGKKVFPEELEYLLNRSPIIKDSMVWGENEGDDVYVSAKFVLDPNDYKGHDGRLLDEERIRERLDSLVSDINQMMPSFKYIKYYVYSFHEMVTTTTHKIKRAVEKERIQYLLAASSSTIRKAHRSEIDALSGESKQAEGARPITAAKSKAGIRPAVDALAELAEKEKTTHDKHRRVGK